MTSTTRHYCRAFPLGALTVSHVHGSFLRMLGVDLPACTFLTASLSAIGSVGQLPTMICPTYNEEEKPSFRGQSLYLDICLSFELRPCISFSHALTSTTLLFSSSRAVPICRTHQVNTLVSIATWIGTVPKRFIRRYTTLLRTYDLVCPYVHTDSTGVATLLSPPDQPESRLRTTQSRHFFQLYRTEIQTRNCVMASKGMTVIASEAGPSTV